MHFRQFLIVRFNIFPPEPIMLGNLGCRLTITEDGNVTASLLYTPINGKGGKKPHNLEWGRGLPSLSDWGKSKASHVGCFKCFSFNTSSIRFCFIFLFVQKWELVPFIYSSFELPVSLLIFLSI